MVANTRPRSLLVFSQVYVPDPAALGQYLHDACAELVRRGWRVQVITAARGYDDASRRYPLREVIEGVQVRRLGLASFGKRSMAIRLAGAVAFLAQAIAWGLFARRPDVVLVSTSPPMAPALGLLIAGLRRRPLVWWAMDLNPDQAVALGTVKEDALPARLMRGVVRATLRRAAAVVTLDSDMAVRLRRQSDPDARLRIIPPWPLREHDVAAADGGRRFRDEHDLSARFVLMYSGNISPAHPLDTLLQAVHRLRETEPNLLLLVIGGGQGREAVQRFIEEQQATNIRVLAYQPRERLGDMLAAADVQVAAMGAAMVGIVHPSKVYGAMAAGRPVLALAPAESCLGRLVDQEGIGWRIDHGDVEAAMVTLRAVMTAGDAKRRAMGERARELTRTSLGREALLGRFVLLLETLS